jgi:hypothetical protein
VDSTSPGPMPKTFSDPPAVPPVSEGGSVDIYA